MLFVLVVFALPLSLRCAFMVTGYDTPAALSSDKERVVMSSSGLLPDPESHPEARVVVFSAPMSGRRGQFLTHNWIVFKRENATRWSRYEVLGYASRDSDGLANGAWLGNRPTLNRYAPDGFWFGRRPTIIADAKGAAAAAIIGKIEKTIRDYEEAFGHYRFWPGPNSNTFIAALLRAVPELRASLPPTAIGKDYKPGVYLGPTDSQTGIEATIWGLFGFKIGRVEGLELNLFSLVAGLDFNHPALKLPGFGRIDIATQSDAADRVSSAKSVRAE
jgi:hypothetical protein